ENDELRTKLNLLLTGVPVKDASQIPVELQRAQIVNVDRQNKTITVEPAPKKEYTLEESFDNEQLYQAFKKRLIEEAPSVLAEITRTVPEIQVILKREKITMDTSNTDGRIAFLIADGFFSMNRVCSDVVAELANRGLPTMAPTV